MKLVRPVLLGLIAVGLFGAFKVSYDTLTGVAPCPAVAGIPACFVVLAGYSLMLITVSLQLSARFKVLFLIGWLPVFLLAITGSVFELMNGNTCPMSESGIALCYLSLLFSIGVIVLYVFYLKLPSAKVSNRI
jgi:hypothetical protein